MFKDSQLTKSTYKVKEVADMLGVTTITLKNWEKVGRIVFERTPTNIRILSKEALVEVLNQHNLYYDDRNHTRKDVIYARVSSNDQKKNGDMDRQIQFLISKNKDLQNLVILSDVGSGLNDKRKNLQKLLQMVMNDEVNRIFVTYRDRLTRFGYSYLETMFKAKGVDIIVVNQKSENSSVEQELTRDLLSLIASFSGRLYGLRSNKNKEKNTHETRL